MSDSPEIYEVTQLRKLVKEAKDILEGIVYRGTGLREAATYLAKLEDL